MSYENAPATKLLGTHCLCCNRPLVDAASVTANVGPDCREKYGYNVEIPEEARAEANAIVHRIAADTSAATVEQDIARLRALGLTVLADRLVARLGAEPVVTITVAADGNLLVKTPFNATFVETLKREIPFGARAWNKAMKVWTVAPVAKAGLWTALRAAFAGEVGVGPKGRFTIEGAASVPASVPTSAPVADDGEPPAEFVREDGSVDCAAWGESLMPKATPSPVATNFTCPEGSYSRDRIHRAHGMRS